MESSQPRAASQLQTSGGSLREAVSYDVSVILPVFNEADILEDVMHDMVANFKEFSHRTEILICENGSLDASKDIAEQLAEKFVDVRVLVLPEPSYGRALRMGITQASSDKVVIFNADLWCIHFYREALVLIDAGADLVVGSKRLQKGGDQRPWIRKTITGAFNRFLSLAFGFRGTDTHGLKALRRSKLLPVLERCVTSREVFDTEFVIKAQRAGLPIRELPIEVVDTRPARLSLLRRVPPTVVDLVRIWLTLR